MKKYFLSLGLLLFVFTSCEKRKCKDRQQRDIQLLYDQEKKELDNQNLTIQQIQAIAEKYQEKQKEIMAECQLI